MTPKLKFQFSHIYHRRLLGTDANKKMTAKLSSRAKTFSNKWNQEGGKRILTELSRVTKIPWVESEIEVYLIAQKGCNFSSPLTINANLTPDEMVDVLTHELIHRLLVQATRSRASWRGVGPLYDKYMPEGVSVYVHVLVYAIHTHIYGKIRGLHRMRRDRKRVQNLKAYRRAWQIVDEHGYESIIQSIRGE